MTDTGDKMTREEQFIYDWQYRRLGGFRSALINAIKVADQGNRKLLGRGFPDEVGGYKKYSEVPGWWDEVEAKGRGVEFTANTRREVLE